MLPSLASFPSSPGAAHARASCGEWWKGSAQKVVINNLNKVPVVVLSGGGWFCGWFVAVVVLSFGFEVFLPVSSKLTDRN